MLLRLCLLLILLPFINSAQELSYSHYTTKDGLPQMQVTNMTIDPKGNLWLATRGGISRFDGKEFENFEDVECLPNYVSAISSDKNGKIWMSDKQNVYSFDGHQCQNYPLPEWAHRRTYNLSLIHI